MKSMLRTVNDHGNVYQALLFVCPGCLEFGGSGLHMLPVNTENNSPSWSFDGDFERPTLNPSILTYKDRPEFRCHSFLRNGIFEFLDDCSHSLANQHVPIPDLPQWVVDA